MGAEITGIVAAKGFDLAQKGIAEVAKRAHKLAEVLRGSYKILSQEIVIHCLEQTEEISIAFEAKGGVLGRKVHFPFGKPSRVRLRPLFGLEDVIDALACVLDDGFEIKFPAKGDGVYILDAQYDLRDTHFVDSLVEKNSAREAPKGKESEYWMHAELRHPKALKTRVGRLDLRDVAFNVDVGVSEDIKTVVPDSFHHELSVASELLSEVEPHRKRLLGQAHTAAKRERSLETNIAKVLGDLQEMFFPSTFKKFVSVKQDFRLAEVERGTSFYEALPFPTWPKSMSVTSRTDLNLDRCAAEGVLAYQKDEFLHKIAKILGV